MSKISVTDLLKSANASYIGEEKMRAMGKKTLRAIATYNGVATPKTPEIVALIDLYGGIGVMDINMADRILGSADYQTSVHIRAEGYVATRGGQITYTPTEAKYKDLSMKELKRPNLPIPMPFGVEVKYDNLIPVASLVSQLVKNVSGSWQSNVNSLSWGKVFKTGVSPIGMQMVAQSAVAILGADPRWTELDPLVKNSIQGPELLVHVACALNRLTEEQWDFLNTEIVFRALTVMEQRGTEWHWCVSDDGSRVVKPSCYQFIKRPRSPVLQYYPTVARYLGGVIPGMLFPTANGTMKNAIEASQRLREVQGSDSSCCALLSSMRDYSGMTDEMGRRVQWTVSSVLSVWRMGRMADVQLWSVGDFQILKSSLSALRAMITSRHPTTIAMFSSSAEFMCDVKYILSSPGDVQKIPGVFHSELVMIPRDKSVIVYFGPGSLPTSPEKGVKVDYDPHSKALLPKSFGSNDYVLYGPVYGDWPFQSDPEVHQARRSSTNILGEWPTKPFVYRWSTSSGFHGVMSSFRDFSLIGLGPHPLSGGKWDMTKNSFYGISLELVRTQKAWYAGVVEDCRTQCMIFVHPVNRYSGISNLIYQTKSAAVHQLGSAIVDGPAMGQQIIRKVKASSSTAIDFAKEEMFDSERYVQKEEVESLPASTASSSSAMSVSHVLPFTAETIDKVPSAEGIDFSLFADEEDDKELNYEDDDEEVLTDETVETPTGVKM